MLRRLILVLGLLPLTLAFPGSRCAADEPPVKAGNEALDHKVAEKPELEHQTVPQKADITKAEAPLAIWTVVVFVGLMLILGKFAWKPLIKALQERETHLEQVLLDSERARNEAEAIAAENRRQLAQAADKVRDLIEEARKEALLAAGSIIAKAQAEAEASRQRAEREIAGAKDQALMEIWSSTADLAVSVAGKVLSKEMGADDHKRLVEMAMGELPVNGREGSKA